MLFFFLAHRVTAWHDPVHELITRVALQSLPPSMRQHWAAEFSKLTSRYCLYPDIYHNAEPAEKTRMKAFCEVGGRPIHNVTWKRAEDIQSLEYLLRNVADGMRSGDGAAAAQYAGTLAHFHRRQHLSGARAHSAEFAAQLDAGFAASTGWEGGHPVAHSD